MGAINEGTVDTGGCGGASDDVGASSDGSGGGGSCLLGGASGCRDRRPVHRHDSLRGFHRLLQLPLTPGSSLLGLGSASLLLGSTSLLLAASTLLYRLAFSSPRFAISRFCGRG